MLQSQGDMSRYVDTILDTIQEGLLVMSPTGLILFMNQAAQRITGYTSEELVGQSCTVLECTGCHIFDQGAGPQWCELFVAGRVASKRCRVTGKDRTPIHVVKRATVLKDDRGQVIGAVETLNDVSTEVAKEQEIQKLRKTLAREDGFHGLVGQSHAMRRVYALIEDAARSDAAVIITGESGTGKELVARAIHKLGPRSQAPFIKVDCVAMNENVLESELFGHVRGAYTGADRSRAGRFELAAGGTVFLDEIGDVPRSTQVKLLRVLEEKVVERVGDNRTIPVDVRVITATNRDLGRMMTDGLFREDLFYRIHVVPIRLPSLRDRREDIPLLTQSFVDRLAAKTGQAIEGVTPEAMAILYRYSWPGNVRELRNTLEYAFVVRRSGWIGPEHLPENIVFSGDDSTCRPKVSSGGSDSRSTGPEPPGDALQVFPHPMTPLAVPAPPSKPASTALAGSQESDERSALLAALRRAEGNQSLAARILGVSRMTVWKRMKRYGLRVERGLGDNNGA